MNKFIALVAYYVGGTLAIFGGIAAVCWFFSVLFKIAGCA